MDDEGQHEGERDPAGDPPDGGLTDISLPAVDGLGMKADFHQPTGDQDHEQVDVVGGNAPTQSVAEAHLVLGIAQVRGHFRSPVDAAVVKFGIFAQRAVGQGMVDEILMQQPDAVVVGVIKAIRNNFV